MTHQDPSATAQQQDAPGAELTSERSDKGAQPSTGNPYLKVFGADTGASEFELRKRTVTIGRSEDNDITLPNHTVSRAHAKITRGEGGFTLTDANSTIGTTANGRPIETHTLKHGDSIQIAMYVLQFRTHHVLPGAEKAAAKAKSLLRGDYCTVPSTMRVKFRALTIGQAGENVQVGQGGLLIPTTTPPSDEACLELHLSITKGLTRRFLGELMGAIQEGETHYMCVKLHMVSDGQYEVIVSGASPGPWMDAIPT